MYINLVLLRFYKVLQDVKYLRWLKASKRYINIRFAATPGLFLGLSSIGESFLDIYQFLHDKEDFEIAKEIAENITMYSIKRDNGIVYPGRQNLRLSCDYATGSSGIGIFLNRLIKNKKRKFVNDYLLED